MMKMRHILYISLVLLIAGCTNEENFSDTLSGNGEKTPLLINATINTGRAHTRASGNNFVFGDELLTYVRHVKSGDAINNYSYVSDDPGIYNKLVTYTKGNAAMGGAEDDVTRETSDLTSAAYWDDFSNSSSADTYLRTGGHGLQSYYGYCYNGGTPTSIDLASGELVWSVLQDQSTANAVAVQHSDLLWSPTQEKVAYSHESSHDANHGTLTIPYTHAMSQITVTVIADEGFEGSTDGSKKPLNNTILQLNAMNTVTTLTAPTTTFSPLKQETGDNIKMITMFPEAYDNNTSTVNYTKRNYTAIVAPGTKLKEGNLLLNITNADRNNYTVNITGEMVDGSHWASGHAVGQYGDLDSDEHNCVITQPGKNYHLDVTIKKSAVQAHSSLANWTDVNATANGDIYFPDDVEVIIDDSYNGTEESESPVNVEIIDKDQFKNNASFSLFRVQATEDNTNNLGNDSEAPKDHVARLNENYAFESISTFTNIGGDPDDYWTNAPELYWPNNSAKFYYRALAKFNSVDAGANNITYVGEADRSTKGTSVSQGTIGEGHDILWGTTPKHYGSAYQKTYQRGYPIPPRTHGVPIVFEHAMSKVSFTLETTDDESVSADNAKMELSEASFKISNLYTAGTIRIDDGNIDLTGSTSDAISVGKGETTNQQTRNLVTDLIVVPQSLEDAIVTITFTDGESNVYSTYTIPLNQCVVLGVSTPITAWERGKNYSYTIKIKKEAVQFHALVKDWEEVTGSGNAALEW